MSSSSTQSPLRRALHGFIDARNAALIEARRTLKIGELDARALLFVAANPGARPTQLRGYLGITSAGVTTLIDRLVDRDAVRRDVDPHDRRVNRITVTVDLGILPWSALTRFDTDFDQAVSQGDAVQNELFATTLDGFTHTVVALARAS
ncbi:MarR family winged helix-turn-helix transcriptional regulator [Microbacterium sp. P07]|uniref:MarR family winged helix-turn-helix transcriptional regulator n=1 Tax=Microbacterium sp. P07 TaxID=3366952 RepID=UPI003745EFF4